MLSQKIKQINQEITAVAKEPITIVGATKTVDISIINQLPALGINIVGENKAQELVSKQPFSHNLEWHFIGQLQTNKVRSIIDKVTMIQSVDRIKLAEVIQKEASLISKVIDVLIEVNVGGEENKGGIEFRQALEFANKVTQFPNLCVRGLMTVLPVGADKELYIQMKVLYNTLKEKNDNIKYLSMGMSGDYITAVKCGANMIRLGSAIFGERAYL
ncbi:MAG: YggS family pyridoxal phosphate-dependent enzyme [Firmicutes bacterium]|nr:YggS family pyridoxal phosphate-dependent enzyme [Bacillota bacterium]